MDTNYNSGNVLHSLFDVIDRTAFRNWATRSIRGAGREFHQRHVFLLHSRPATISDSRRLLSPEGKICRKIIRRAMEGEFVLKYDAELDDIIQVA